MLRRRDVLYLSRVQTGYLPWQPRSNADWKSVSLKQKIKHEFKHQRRRRSTFLICSCVYIKIRSNYPGGRMIATSKLTNDMWKLHWLDEPVLNNRVFSWNKCAWKSKLRTDYSVDAAAVIDKLVDLTHKQEMLVSLEPIGCTFQSCDITFLLKESFFGNLENKTRDSPEATPKPKFEKEDL
ncbi:unnamed protein product [Trichogramma brassicae]|uniref:Uncharacterized protein n=1 Tax=Trichogramma brassicae TaxID=86971 RepID=A0A6H5ILZ1_9HYME|nr:unnamed protein product [Trichogramma brassicae]